MNRPFAQRFLHRIVIGASSSTAGNARKKHMWFKYDLQYMHVSAS